MGLCSGKELKSGEISDMIVKGLNRLNNEKVDFEKLNMDELEKLVGRTGETGNWIHDDEEKVVVYIRLNMKVNQRMCSERHNVLSAIIV